MIRRRTTAGAGALILLSAATFAAAQTLDPGPARYQGLLKGGTEDLRVVLRLDERERGRPSCYVNILQGGAEALRCTSVIVTPTRVAFTPEDRGVRFEGVRSADGQTIEGSWIYPTSTRPLRLTRATGADVWPTDPYPHVERSVVTKDGVRLEVLDFGGTGSPVVLLSGFGQSAHAFDHFGPRLAAKHRVIAVTRRAHGISDAPPLDPNNYRTQRLVQDVVEVMDALSIPRAAVAGWSFGGSEVSGLGTHFASRVSALIYLDAGYAYAYYAPGNAIPESGNAEISLNDLREKLQAARTAPTKAEIDRRFEEILTRTLPDLEADIVALRERKAQLNDTSVGPPAEPFRLMMRLHEEKFGPVPRVPVLNIYALPAIEPDLPAARRADEELGLKWRREQIARYRAGNPSARVVEIEGGDHAVFDSHPDAVLREIEAFLGGLR